MHIKIFNAFKVFFQYSQYPLRTNKKDYYWKNVFFFRRKASKIMEGNDDGCGIFGIRLGMDALKCFNQSLHPATMAASSIIQFQNNLSMSKRAGNR